MLVTIAIPAYNQPDLLLEAVESVRRQTYAAWELVVIDDGSDTPISELSLRALVGERLRLARHEKPSGVASAKNAGVRMARGEIIFNLDHDDLLAPTALQEMVGAFERYPTLDCLFLGVEPFGRFEKGTAENRRHRKVPALWRAGESHCQHRRPGGHQTDPRPFGPTGEATAADLRAPCPGATARGAAGL